MKKKLTDYTAGYRTIMCWGSCVRREKRCWS